MTNKLSYSLPDSINYRFRVRFDLDETKFIGFIKYLDSLTYGKEKETYKNKGGTVDYNYLGFHLEHLNLNHPMWRKINDIAFFSKCKGYHSKQKTGYFTIKIKIGKLSTS